MIRAPLPRAISRCISARSASIAFALDAPNLNTSGGRADLALRLQCDALRFEAAMVDARVDVEFGQALIGDLRPAFAPALDHLRAVPVPHLLAKTVLVHRAHGQHDMGMGFGHAVLGHVPMHIEIGDHAPIHELSLHEVAGQLDALSLGHLAGKREFHLAGKLRVLADLEGFNIVPKPFAVAPRLRRVLRQHHLGMDDAALGGKVVGCDQGARHADASPSGRRRMPPRWRRTCGQ